MKPGDDLDQLFADARGAISPPEGASERVNEAVLQAIRAPVPPADGGPGAAGGGAIGAKMAGVIAIALVVGGGGWALMRSKAPAPPPESAAPAVVASAAPGPAEPAEPSEPEATPTAPPASSAPEPEHARALARGAVGPSASAPSGDPLAEELALMKRARTALGSGASAEALALLDEHARLFPKGVFTPERAVSRIRALCALGRLSEARAAYQRISRGASRSPHLASLRRSCPGLEPDAP